MKNYLLLFIFILFTTPAHARLIQVGSTTKDIAVYETATLKQNFEVVGKVSVTAALPTQLVEKIKSAANKHGGDAVLLYKVLRHGNLPGVGGIGVDGKITTGSDPTATLTAQGVGIGQQEWPIAEGVIVRYVAQGVTSIDEKTAIKVLE